MSKIKSLGLAVAFALMAVGFYVDYALWPFLLAVAASLLFLGIATQKYYRDRNYTRQAKEPQTIERVTGTNPNNRLFVPPPIDK